MRLGITQFENIKRLIEIIEKDKNFNGKAEVFINVKNELVITFQTKNGYAGYFLNFDTGKIRFSE